MIFGLLNQITAGAMDYLAGKAPLGARRSPQWPQVRKAYLKFHPTCECCGGKKKLEVHHRIPFHENPHLELHWENLITLCETGKRGLNCHLLIGHLGDYRRTNPDVGADAKAWKEKLHA